MSTATNNEQIENAIKLLKDYAKEGLHTSALVRFRAYISMEREAKYLLDILNTAIKHEDMEAAREWNMTRERGA